MGIPTERPVTDRAVPWGAFDISTVKSIKYIDLHSKKYKIKKWKLINILVY